MYRLLSRDNLDSTRMSVYFFNSTRPTPRYANREIREENARKVAPDVRRECYVWICCVRVRVCAYVYVCVCVCVYIYIYIHICI